MRKGAQVFAIIAVAALVVFVFAGAVFAAEMSGKVTAVDPVKGVLTLTSGTVDVGFDCSSGSIISDVKVGDTVKVVYSEKNGKKFASEVTKEGSAPKKRRAPVGC
jgi:hypothetical protein